MKRLSCLSVRIPKEHALKLRVTAEMKARIVKLAQDRGEGESVIVREALKLYLAQVSAP